MAAIQFFDTCMRIGRSRAPEPPGCAPGAADALAVMQRHNIAGAAVEHAVAMEASPRLGHDLLDREIATSEQLRPAWHLMPAVSARIERATTDPQELLARRVALGRVDAKDFCQGAGDRACFGAVLDACAAVRLPVFVDFRRQGDALTFDFAICERYPRIPFVIEGFAGYPLHRVVWCLRNYPNLYLSTVGFALFRGVQFVCEEVGAGRMIFGSDWPASAIGLAQGSVLLAAVGDEERAAVAGGTFRRLLAGIGVGGVP